MAASKVRRRTRPRGAIDVLPSGALRVRVYAGQDPLTKKRHVLSRTIPAEATNSEPDVSRDKTL